MSQPLCRDGLVYLLDKTHGLVCFDIATGGKVWADEHKLTPRGRNPHATLVWVGQTGKAIALNSKGELVLFELNRDGYRELARQPVVGETWAHPAYAGRRVYARDDEQIVCVELPAPR